MNYSFPLFEIPVVSPDLNQEEMILQIADSLDYLSIVVNTIFDSINQGVKCQHHRISDISTRVDAVKSKIEKLTGSRSATKVFSPSKYPSSNAYRSYTSIFSNTEKIPPPFREEVREGRRKVNTESEASEKLQFFHVRNKSKLLKKNIDIVPKEGLGDIPPNIDSVASLLLFNTAESPYKNYVAKDPMKVSAKSRNDITAEDQMLLDAAPDSIAKGEQLLHTPENYLYFPSLGEVPNLNVPMDLPDLPGVADDLRYDCDSGPGFAPSVASTPALPDLPKTTPDEPNVIQCIFSAAIDASEIIPAVQVTSEPEAKPPPPVLIPMPPPPPPLPPSTLDLPPPEPITSIRQTSVTPLPASADNARSTLMDAIRKAGGSSKLRSVKENQDELRRKNEEKAIAAGGDLMSDLHNRLLMRRKGISGDKLGGGSAMAKISSMIPPPNPTAQQDSSATEDDDWD